jgi:hypothetical protein
MFASSITIALIILWIGVFIHPISTFANYSSFTSPIDIIFAFSIFFCMIIPLFTYNTTFHCIHFGICTWHCMSSSTTIFVVETCAMLCKTCIRFVSCRFYPLSSLAAIIGLWLSFINVIWVVKTAIHCNSIIMPLPLLPFRLTQVTDKLITLIFLALHWCKFRQVAVDFVCPVTLNKCTRRFLYCIFIFSMVFFSSIISLFTFSTSILSVTRIISFFSCSAPSYSPINLAALASTSLLLNC